jgi:hypothetical protein
MATADPGECVPVVMNEPDEGHLGSVLEYLAAITAIPAGKFVSKVRLDVQKDTTSLYAAPFFALSSLAPEILRKPAATVVLGGHVRDMAAEGGRWLTLFSRLFQPECKLAFSICSPGRPAAQTRIKQLFALPPQRVLNRQWSEFLVDASPPADAVLICGLTSFEDIWAAATSEHLVGPAEHGILLWSGVSEPDLVVVRAMLRARHFDVSEPVPFCGVPEMSQAIVRGAWWLRIRLTSANELRQLDANERESFSNCFNGYQAFIDAAPSPEAAALVAQEYGTTADVTVDGRPVKAILVTSTMGIEQGSGRIFQGHDANTLSWRSDTVVQEVMNLAPEDDSARSQSTNRYQRMSWVGRALAQVRDVGAEAPTLDITSDASKQDIRDEEKARRAETTLASKPSEESTKAQTVTVSTPLRKRARLSRSAGITNVLAVAARLGKPGSASTESFILARNEISAWLRKKGFEIDSSRSSFTMETPYGEISVESDADKLWSLRFDDRSQMSEGAFWRVETTLLGGETAAIGLRVVQVRQTESAPPPKPGVPRVIASIADRVGLYEEGTQLKSCAWSPASNADITKLFELLSNQSRLQPVIVISAMHDVAADISMDRLASRLTGVAHVVRIGRGVADEMIQRFGRSLATYGTAIRLYRPGFSREADPFHHPLWTFSELPLPGRIVDDIAEEACAIGVQTGDLDERVPSFQDVRNLIASARMRGAIQQTQELASSAQEERDRQHAVRREIEALLDIYTSNNKDLVEANRKLTGDCEVIQIERDAALDEVRRLRYQISTTWSPDSTQVVAIEEDPEQRYPETWDDLETWVECFGNDRLVLLPQAAKAARSSAFQDIPFVYKVLEFLVERYVPLRTRNQEEEGPRLRYETALAELAIEVSPVGDAVDDKRYKKEYRRRYNGKDIKLNLHAKRGVGFDPATVFRLYFWYDDANERVVVGHLPSHLTNRISHSG